VRDAVHGALAELKARPLHPSRVERAKSRLRYEMTKALEDSKTTASALAKLIHFERTPETMDDLFETYAKLGPADLQSAAQTYFTDDRRFFVSVAPGAEISGFDSKEGVDAAAASALFEGPAEVPDAPAASTATSTVPIRAKLMPSDGTPLVTLSYVFTTGAAYDPPGKKGLAALTAAMIADGGTRELSLAEIDAATYPMAADLEWQVDKEMTRLSATVHQDNLEAFYAFASAQLLDPGFRAEDLERNKEMIAHLIRTDLVANNDEELGKEALYRLIYGEAHPYSTYNLGIAAQVEKLTLDDVKRFYERHFRPRGLILGVAGGYPEDFPQKVMNDLGRLPQGSDAVLRLQPPVASEGRRALVLEKATPGVAVSAGAPIDVRRGDDDWIALWLARSWLGEHRSSNGELFREIREKRDLNFGDYAYIEYFPRAMFQFYPDANLGRKQQIFQMWLRPFRSNQEAHFGTRLAVQTLEELVEEGLTQAQLDATRSYLKKFVSLLMQTQARQLGYGVDAAFYGTPDFATYVRRGLDALTLDAVNAAIREHLDPSRLSFVFVTRDADNLVRRLTRDTPSQIESKPGLEEEDEAIAKKELNMGSVTSKPADAMF
jgi:zinc protease